MINMAPRIILRIILIVVFLIVAAISIYQTKRSDKVFDIRLNWIGNGEWDKLRKYTWKYMYKPNKHNWYGIKYPKETDYP